MQIQQNISPVKERGTLKDFAPLVFAFFACLVLLSLYQNVRLYVDGVLDSFLNKSLLLLILHNLGFAAITGLILVFVFNILEGIKPDLGFKMTKAILFGLLLMEGLLIDYYVREYEILDDDIFKLGVGADNVFRILTVISMSAVLYFVFKYLYKGMASVYQVVSRMYPFTIILFSLFLAILNSDKKPINENKTQHFVVHMIDNALDFNTYEGTAELNPISCY